MAKIELVNISPQAHDFPYRRGANEFQQQFTGRYMSTEHTTIIREIAERNNLTFENATAMAVAMFCAIEDLMLYHYDIDLPGFSINVKPQTVAEKKRVRKWQSWLNPITLKGAGQHRRLIIKSLVRGKPYYKKLQEFEAKKKLAKIELRQMERLERKKANRKRYDKFRRPLMQQEFFCNT